jgi:hypothetical protein
MMQLEAVPASISPSACRRNPASHRRFDGVPWRWIAKFEKPRLEALGDLKRRVEKTHG